jgi:m7GpppX diphosphatase
MAEPPPSDPASPEALIPQFEFSRVLKQDQAGRRIVLVGSIASQPALLIAERAAFPSGDDQTVLSTLATTLRTLKNLGANDIYAWFLASSGGGQPPDLKLNLIYPCTESHVKKYSAQRVRVVTETPEIYARHVRGHMQRLREAGRLNWVFNIIEGRTEQEDVVYREYSAQGGDGGDEGFLMLPDLNWDRKTLSGLHLLGIVERRDIWSLRDLQRAHVPWLKHMRQKLIDTTVRLYPDIEEDELKLYVHCESNPIALLHFVTLLTLDE